MEDRQIYDEFIKLKELANKRNSVENEIKQMESQIPGLEEQEGLKTNNRSKNIMKVLGVLLIVLGIMVFYFHWIKFLDAIFIAIVFFIASPIVVGIYTGVNSGKTLLGKAKENIRKKEDEIKSLNASIQNDFQGLQNMLQ